MRKRRISNAVVECGDFRWRGYAKGLDNALIAAFCKKVPKNPSLLVRVSVSGMRNRVKRSGLWHYIAFESALKIAGYSIKKTKNGFSIT